MLKPNSYLNWHSQKVGNVSWVLTQCPVFVGLAKSPKYIFYYIFCSRNLVFENVFCPADLGWTPAPQKLLKLRGKIKVTLLNFSRSG